MAIFKAKNFIDVYKSRASSDDINDLSGRDGRPDITQYVCEKISQELSLGVEDKVVDVGCGDGTLIEIAIFKGVQPSNIIGILPSKEEVIRVQKRFKKSFGDVSQLIAIGSVHATGLSNNSVNKCICNSVLLLLPSEQAVAYALDELVRITKPGGLILLGEIPDLNEIELVNPINSYKCSSSSIVRAYGVMKEFGAKQVFKRLINRFKIQYSKKLIVVPPNFKYWALPEDFEKLANSRGLVLRKKYRSPSLSEASIPTEIPHRWNYIFEVT